MQEGPDVGAKILGPSAACCLPRVDIRSRMKPRVEFHALLPHIRPGCSLRVVGEQKGHRWRYRLDVCKKIGVSTEHIHERHKFVVMMDMSKKQKHGGQPPALSLGQ